MNVDFDQLRDYIIYENAKVIALNKPEGMLSIPDGYDPDLPNLRDILATHFGKIWVVHRLDKDTSGIILFAKNSATHQLLNNAFMLRKTTKRYIALIHGTPFWSEKTITYPLLTNGDRRHRTIISIQKGKNTLSEVKIQEKHSKYCRILITPRTGYTHQIRSHLSNIGHPIIGDTLYDRQRIKDHRGKIAIPQLENGLFLHAQSLQFLMDEIKLPLLNAKIPEKFLTLNRK